MSVSRTRVWSGLCLVALSTISVTRAAGPDLRLVNAAAQHDTATLRRLLKAGVAVNTARPDGATALLWAAHWDDVEAAALLLRAGAQVNAANDLGVTPLALACENASVAMVETLLTAGADPNAAQVSGLTPLMTAARTGNGSVVTALLARGAHVNAAVRTTQHTPLMWAVGGGRLDIVRTLVEHGADVHARSAIGFTPLLLATRNGDIEMATVLIAAGAGVNETGSDGTHALPLAILSGQDTFALFLLEQGADANARIDGVPALHTAAGDVGMWLRAWLRVRDSAGMVGLDPSRRAPLVKALLAHGADPNARITTSTTTDPNVPAKAGAFHSYTIGVGDLKGATALWVAAWALWEKSGSPDVIRTLLTAGADRRLTTADQTTPIMVAAGLGHREGFQGPGRRRGNRSLIVEDGVKILVEAGADVNGVNEANFVALHGAAYRGMNEVLVYLVEQGANINAQDFRGQTAFRKAQGARQGSVWWQWPDTAALLTQLGADTNLGVHGEVLERQREIGVDAGAPQPRP